MVTPRRPGNARPPGPWVAILVLAPLLSGCSGSRFGEALSRSFPGPSTEVAASTPSPAVAAAPAAVSAPTRPAAAPSQPATGQPATGQAGAAAGMTSGAGPGRPANPAAAGGRSAAVNGSSQAAAAPTPTRPAASAPYRVTIRLPRADPSAPAEVVTEALRAAGVPFEVETIERLGGAMASPAAAPAATAQPAAPPSR